MLAKHLGTPLAPYRDKTRRRVFRADVTLATEGADGDGGVIHLRQVIREPTVHISNSIHLGTRPAAEPGDEGRAQKPLGEVAVYGGGERLKELSMGDRKVWWGVGEPRCGFGQVSVQRAGVTELYWTAVWVEGKV